MSIATVLVAMLVTAFAAAPAAKASKAVVSSFGATGSLGGEFSSSAGGVGGSGVHGVTGDVYVADRGNNRIEQFTAAGVFVRAWGLNVDATAVGTGFEICTKASGNTCQAGATSASIGGAMSAPQAVAVDQATGDVYVASQGFRRIDEFTSSGAFVRSFGQDVVKTGSPNNAPATSAKQTITLSGAAGGFFKISFRGESSTPIAWNATAAEVQSALRAISTVGPGSVTVTGAGPYTVTFAGGLSNAPLPTFGSDGSELTPGGATVATATTVAGATGFEVCDTTAGNVAADCQTGATGGGGGAFGAAMGHLAVAPPGAPNAGNVLVADTTNLRVQEFTTTGAFVRAFGNDVVSLGPGSKGTAEVQSVKVAATSGKFTLTFSGQTTAVLDWNATAAQVESALDALSNIGAVGGNVAVTGGPGDATGSTPYVVTFGGTLRGQNVGQITVSPVGLGVAVGTSLTCSTTTNATSKTFQWLANGIPVAGATATTYTVEAGDAGKAIQCQVFAANANAGSTQVSSPAIVASPFPVTSPPTPPASIVAPTPANPVNGTVETCAPGSWSGSPTFGFQWYRNGVAIPGATSNTYSVQAADLPSALQCAVTGTNAGGSATLISANRATSPAPSPGAPVANAAVAALSIASTATDGAPAAEVCAAAAFDICKAGVSGAGSGMFGSGSPTRVAVDSSGQTYAVDGGNNRLQKFNFAGTAASSFGGSLFADGKVTDVASDPSNDDVYAVKAGVSEVQVLTNKSEGGTYTLSFDGATTAPIDFEATGPEITTHLEALSTIGAGNVTVNGNLKGLTKTRTVTFTGALATSDVEELTADASELDENASIGIATSVGGVSSNLLQLDNSANLIDASVVHPTITNRSGLSLAPVSAAAGAGNVYLSAPLTTGQRVFVLNAPVPPVASMAPTPCTGVSATGITFNGTVNPTSFVTGWHFEYVTDAVFESSGFANSLRAPAVDEVLPFTDSSSHPVAEDVGGLLPNTSYRVRLVATKSFGAGSHVSTPVACATSATAPGITSVGPNSITDTSTRLNGFVNPHGQPTSYSFEYVDDATFQADVAESGVGHGFDHAVAVPDPAAGLSPGSAPIPVSREVADLEPETTYHFRLLASNGTGDAVDGEQSFETRTPAQSRPLPERGYELVSAPDTNGLKAFNYVASKDGGHYVYFFGIPVPGAENGAGVYFRASRSNDGSGSWSQEYIGVPGPPPDHELKDSQILVSEDDISTVAIPTSYGLDPDDQNGASDTYVRDIDGPASWISRNPAIGPGLPQTDAVEANKIEYVAPDGNRILFTSGRRLLPSDIAVGVRLSLYEWSREPFDARQALTVDALTGTYTLTFDGESTGAAGTGDLTAGSALVENVSISAGAFIAGEAVSGPGIPPGTMIEAVGPESLTLSASATEDKVGIPLASNLPASAPAAVVEAALSALPTIGGLSPTPGSVAVSGGPGGPGGGVGSYVIAFGGALGSVYVPQLTAGNVDLSGGASSVAVATLDPGGNLRLVAIAPGSTTGFISRTSLGANLGVSEPLGTVAIASAVSRDGSRIAFEVGDNAASARLYLRIDHEETVEVSESVTDPTPQSVHFWGADSDHSLIVFTSASPLTADSHAPDTANGAADLYVYDVDSDVIRDLTPLPVGGAGVKRVYAVSDDSRRVYFTAASQLVAGEGVSGAPNLYMAELDGDGNPAGPLKFIATIDETEDDPNGNFVSSGLVRPQAWREVASSPDGSVLAFRNRLSPVAGVQTDGWPQVFVYDALRDELSCVSCPADGSAPTAAANLTPAQGVTATEEKEPLPLGNGSTSLVGPHARTVSDEGAVFFQTATSLVSDDTNGLIDVYEYRGGRLGLISTGIGGKQSIFASASVDGSTVFFLSPESLAPGAEDGIQHVFAARVGGGFQAVPPPPPPCTGDECRPPVSPAASGQGAGSATFTGPVDPPPDRTKKPHCRKGKVYRKGKCVKRNKRHSKRARAARGVSR